MSADRCGGSLGIERRFCRLSILSGGGGGSRTRVRKYVPAELYMRVRFCVLVPGVRKRPKPPETRPGVSHGRAPSRHLTASLLNDI